MSARKNRNKKLMKSRKLIHEYQRMEAEVKQLKAKRERERERERELNMRTEIWKKLRIS